MASRLGVLLRLLLPAVLVSTVLTASTAGAAPRPPALSVHAATAAESPGTVVRVEVTLARKDGDATVRWRTRSGTAVAGADFVGGSGTLRFTKDRTTRWIRVRILDDALTEGAESFTVQLRKATGARIRAKVATVTIGANDGPYPDRVLTVRRSGPGGAYLRTDPEVPGLDSCNLYAHDCSATVPHGTSVSLSLEVQGSSAFDGWSGGGCSGTGSCSLVVDRDLTVTAALSRLPSPFLAKLEGAGHLSISGALEDGCDVTFTLCDGLIAHGATATVTVHKDNPGDVVRWTGDEACTVGETSCPIVGGRELTAHVMPPTQTLTVSGAGSGNGTVTAPGISCTVTAGALSGDCTEAYASDTWVLVQATPQAGSRITQLAISPWCNWSGSSTTVVQCQVPAWSDLTAIATFALL